MSRLVKMSRVEENTGNMAGFEVVKDILRDIMVPISIRKDCMKAAWDTDDGGTEAMPKKLLYETEKDHRGLQSWLK